MTQFYSNPDLETDKWALPDCEVFQLTAHEVAAQDEELVRQYLKRYPLANMNSRDRDKLLDAIVEEEGITGGWFYWYCLPGCLPDSSPIGPYNSEAEAIAAARDEAAE